MGLSLQNLHFGVEAFGDGVVAIRALENYFRAIAR
jgi:hypothetical protein